MSPEVAISTITLARSPAEEQRIINALEHLSQSGIQIVAVDGGSPDLFIQKLSRLASVDLIVSEKKGLFAQVSRSLKEAAKKQPLIFYTESDKEAFFAGGQFQDFLAEASHLLRDDPQTGLVVPSRSPTSFASYPAAQRRYESEINQKTAQLLKSPEVDLLYGPMLIDRDLVPMLNNCPDDIGWGWLTYLRLVAYKKGKQTKGIEMDLPCSLEDRQETEKESAYREEQYLQHLKAIALAKKYS